MLENYFNIGTKLLLYITLKYGPINKHNDEKCVKRVVKDLIRVSPLNIKGLNLIKSQCTFYIR